MVEGAPSSYMHLQQVLQSDTIGPIVCSFDYLAKFIVFVLKVKPLTIFFFGEIQ